MPKNPSDPNKPEDSVKNIKADFDNTVSVVGKFFSSMFEKVRTELTALSTSGESVKRPDQDSSRSAKNKKSRQSEDRQAPLIFKPSDFTDILSKKMHGDRKLKLNKSIKPHTSDTPSSEGKPKKPS